MENGSIAALVGEAADLRYSRWEAACKPATLTSRECRLVAHAHGNSISCKRRIAKQGVIDHGLIARPCFRIDPLRVSCVLISFISISICRVLISLATCLRNALPRSPDRFMFAITHSVHVVAAAWMHARSHCRELKFHAVHHSGDGGGGGRTSE